MTSHDLNPDARELRNFALTSGFIIALLFGILLPWVFSASFALWPWYAGVTLGAWGLAAPCTLRGLFKVWMWVGKMMSRITTPLIMGFVFVFALLPTAVFLRVVLRRDPMARTLDKARPSYRIDSERSDPQNLRRPF